MMFSKILLSTYQHTTDIDNLVNGMFINPQQTTLITDEKLCWMMKFDLQGVKHLITNKIIESDCAVTDSELHIINDNQTSNKHELSWSLLSLCCIYSDIDSTKHAMYLDMVNFLLDNGAKPYLTSNCTYQSALHVASMLHKNDMFHLFVNSVCEDSTDTSSSFDNGFVQNPMLLLKDSYEKTSFDYYSVSDMTKIKPGIRNFNDSSGFNSPTGHSHNIYNRDKYIIDYIQNNTKKLKQLIKDKQLHVDTSITLYHNDPSDRISWTLLAMCCMKGDIDMLRFLLENGANPNLTSNYSYQTPLHIAANNGRHEILQMLVPLVHNIEAKDIYNDTALNYAQTSRHQQCIDILLQHYQVDEDMD